MNDNDLDFFKPGKLYRTQIDTYLILSETKIPLIPKDSILFLLSAFPRKEFIDTVFLLNNKLYTERFAIKAKTWLCRFEQVE